MMLTAQSDDGERPTACAARNHGCRGAGGKGVKSRSSLRISSRYLPSIHPAPTLITGRSQRAFQLLRSGCCRGGVPLKIGGARGRLAEAHNSTSIPTNLEVVQSLLEEPQQPASPPTSSRSLAPRKAKDGSPLHHSLVLLECRALPSTLRPSRPSVITRPL